jgi:ABC-type branched-subunit amino acid transport system substrate-binding protein
VTKRSRPMHWVAAALVAMLALAASGCGGGGGGNGGSQATAGITPNTVTLGSHQPLTGSAAPGYSEIAPGADAYFKYLNSKGGVNGRQIQFIYRDDGYNPTNTSNIVRQLVLQDRVFGILLGLGTPTHTKVVDYLNASHVPDMFVASGCPCWDQPQKQPYTYGWQPDYLIEGKILGNYIKEHFPNQKIAYFYQNDDFGQGGVKGLDQYIPPNQVVSRQPYQPTNTNVGPQISAIQASGAQLVVSFSIPAFTALAELNSVKLGYKPQFVVSNVGSDPATVGSLMQSFSKGTATSPLLEGMITDGYLPSPGDTSNGWIKLFKQVHDQFEPQAPFDANAEYGMAAAYTFAQALKKAGPNPTRQGIVNAMNGGIAQGPGLVPYRYSQTSHAGFIGTQIGAIQGGKVVLSGTPLTTDDANGPIVPFTNPQPQPSANGLP